MTRSSIYLTLRIELRGVRPRVYRTVVVPADITLVRLHQTIQCAMGWEFAHLHEFVINDTHFGPLGPDELMPHLKNEQRVRLMSALAGMRQFTYLYDFGDGWEHDVHLVDAADVPRMARLPYCVDGANACPPEDVGGPQGYLAFVQAMNDPEHPEHAGMKRWFRAHRFDPAAFHRASVNRRLNAARIGGR